MKNLAFFTFLLISVAGVSCRKDPPGPCEGIPYVFGCYYYGSDIYYEGHLQNTQAARTASLPVATSMTLGPSAVSPDGERYYIFSESQVFEINTTNSVVLRKFWLDVKGAYFMHHSKLSKHILIGCQGSQAGSLEIKKLDLEAQTVSHISTCNSFGDPYNSSWMVDEEAGRVYFSSSGELSGINIYTGAISKMGSVTGSSFCHLDLDDHIIYSIGGATFGLYSLDLNSNVSKKILDLPDIKSIGYTGTAYDDENNVLIIMDPISPKLININCKTLAYHSVGFKERLYNLETARYCRNRNDGQ